MGPVTLTARSFVGRQALADCADDFDALCAVCQVPVTGRRPWLQTWIDCYPDWTPQVVCVYDGDELVAAAPLAIKRRGPLTHVTGLGHGPTDDLRLPTRDDAAAATLADAVAAVLREAGSWFFHLDQVPPQEPAVQALLSRLALTELRPGEGMPSVKVTSRDRFAYLSKNTRKALAKIANRLAAAELVQEVRWTRDADEVRALLPQLAAVHRARDEAAGRRSDHEDARAACFYEQVITRHADRGEVDLLTLRLRGELAAYVCAFRDGRALRSWDNRLSPQFADFSAGRLANTEALLHVVESEEYDELDWMQGEEPYKLQSATEVVPRVVLMGWSSTAVRRAHDGMERLRAAKRGSEPLTRLWWAASSVRRKVASARPPT